MAYALALSLVLHIAAALLVIFACSSDLGVKNPGAIIIQDVALAPSLISAKPSPPVITRPMAEPAPETATDKAQSEPTGQLTEQPASAAQTPKIFQTSPLGLGMARGYFTGLSNGISLREDIRDYYFEMVGKINGEWWNRAGTLTEALHQDGVMELGIQRDGTIVSIRILQGTGSREADRLLTEVIQGTRLAPLPPTYESNTFSVPLRIKAPSSLFRLGS